MSAETPVAPSLQGLARCTAQEEKRKLAEGGTTTTLHSCDGVARSEERGGATLEEDEEGQQIYGMMMRMRATTRERDEREEGEGSLPRRARWGGSERVRATATTAEAAQLRQLKMSRGRWLSCELMMLAAEDEAGPPCRGSIMRDCRSATRCDKARVSAARQRWSASARRKSRRTERLGVLPALEPLELLREVGLHLGHLDKRVGRLEALQLADDARHFLHGRRRRQRDGAGGARRKERARHTW